MREKNRNSIEMEEMLPQFTTMNVIDGQAGLVSYSSLIFYSLTIDNILNIIVLLILAGVTIATLTGDNGILTQANKAKDKTKESEEEESGILDNYETTIDEIVNGAITANTIVNAKNKNDCYGKIVTNYFVDSNVEDDEIQWKILYAGTVGNRNEKNIYLIVSDYVKYENLPAGVDENGKITSSTLTKGFTNYTAYWNRDNPLLLNTYKTGSYRITDSRIQALNNDYFNTKKYTSTENNMKALAYMLDITAWSDYANKLYADYAIGGPTIEMLLNSYSQKLNLTENAEYKAQAASNNGYKISNNGGQDWFSSECKQMFQVSEELYVTPMKKNETRTANAYWLASPSNDYNYYLWGVYSTGDVRSNYYSIDDRGFRPVVCLNANVKLKEVEDGYEIIEE